MSLSKCEAIEQTRLSVFEYHDFSSYLCQGIAFAAQASSGGRKLNSFSSIGHSCILYTLLIINLKHPSLD